MIKKAAAGIGATGAVLAAFQGGRLYEEKQHVVRTDASEAHVSALMSPEKGVAAESMPERLARVTRENADLKQRLGKK